MIRRLVAAMAVVGLLGASAVQAHDAERQAQLLDELLRLNSEAVPERIIIKQIRAWCFRFELDGDDIVELRTLGVSDDIIETLIDTGFEDLECEGDDYEYIWYRGVYSPWWYVPYAWGVYWWDPWPPYYIHHGYYYPYSYYPCHYGYGYGYHDGYYGWHGGRYYVAYNPRQRVPAPEPRAHDYTVVSRGRAEQVTPRGAAQQPTSARGAVVARGQIESRRSPTLNPQRGVAAPTATPTAPGHRQAGANGAEQVVARGTRHSQAAAELRKRAQLQPVTPRHQAEPPSARSVRPPASADAPAKRVVTPQRSSRRVTPSPAKRLDLKGKLKRPQRVTPSQPAQRLERGTKITPRQRVSPSKRSSVKTRSSSRSTRVTAPWRSKHSLSRSRSLRSGSSRSISRPSRSGMRASAPRSGRSAPRARGRSR